jgi:hypothetical protein
VNRVASVKSTSTGHRIANPSQRRHSDRFNENADGIAIGVPRENTGERMSRPACGAAPDEA